uniref:uncharacterized protein LOC120952226 n=1 Tax=Anopheles coluzzii TaxID=1518534 RepID=UPI0020FF94A3|nr:uncharacterized protein LOC120952226 [Anopheles coluzzii]
MASEWRYRGLSAEPFVLTVLCWWVTFQWRLCLAVPEPFFHQPGYYYASNSLIRPAANGYGYYEQPSAFSSPAAAESQNVAVYSGHPNYYGMPGYEDRRSVGSRRNSWNDPYLQWKWNNYYNRYYYPTVSGAAEWKDRHDGVQYYNSKRRQDSPQPVESTPEPATTRRPRKKKLFVPNVWG